MLIFACKFRKHIKKTVRIVFILIATPIILLLSAYLLLWLPPIQQKIKDAVLKEVIKKTQGQLSIGNLDFRPFNRLQLQEVYAGDLQGDTLLYAGEMAAGFDLFRLLNKQLLIKSVDLSNFVIHLKKDSLNSDFNFQFLMDAFASQTPDTTSLTLSFRIHDIRFSRGRISYDILSEPVLPDSLFDFNHIRLERIYSETNIHLIDSGNVDLRIHSLSFTEKSGLNVTHLQAILQSAGEKYRLSDVKLQLPHSQLSIPKAYYDSTALHVSWNSTGIHLPDLKMFHPALAGFPEVLTLSGEINGALPQIDLSHFQADYGKHVHLQFRASMDDYGHWQDTPVQFHLNTSSIDDYMVEQLLNRLSDHSQPELPVRPGAIALSGRAQGRLSHLKLILTAESDQGLIQLEGAGGYDFRSKETRFDAFLQSEPFDVGALLQDSIFGLAEWQLQANGIIPASEPIHIHAEAHINRFDFNGYSYKQISANAAYHGDSIQLNVASDDPNLPFAISAYADVGKNNTRLTLNAHLDSIYLDTLYLLPNYKNAFLTGQIRADINGFDPEKMKADLQVDNLRLTTDKGVFYEPSFRLMYAATEKNSKALNISSRIINARARGNCSYAGLQEAVREHFPVLFPEGKSPPKKKDLWDENFDFRMGMSHINSLSDLLDLPRAIPDSALMMGKYSYDGQNIKLSASAYTRFTEADTLQLSLLLSNKDNRLSVIFNVDNKSVNYDIDGSIHAEVEFIPRQGRSIPDMNIRFNPTVWVLNETFFDFNPARMEIREGQYAFHNWLLGYAGNPKEYIRLDGAISTSEADSLTLDISQIQLSTLFGAVKTDVPLSGIADGRVTARRLLSSPLVFARDFAVNQIVFDGNAVGDLKVNCGWSAQYNGLGLRATLGRENRTSSELSGFILPDKDSIALQARIRDIELQWFQKMLGESLYGLSGSLGADVKVSGKLSDPVFSGTVHAKNAKVGITPLNCLYSINDSIFVDPEMIELKKFTILDENKQTLTATGTITHNRFSGLNPNLYLSLSDFLVLNNERQVDSLFYGNLRVNGLLGVKKSNRDWLMTGDITHSNNARVTVNIPSTASAAERYNMITYLSAEPEETKPTLRRTAQPENAPFALPLKINVSLWFDPGLTIGAVFNPVTNDAVHVNGNGMIKLSYDLTSSALSLLGDYEINSGNTTISLANITKKTFSVQQGGQLIFHGDPMATTFSLTALYNLRADLRTLDPSFGNIGIVNTKAPVSCSLTATGNIERMALEYDILLPAESDDIQRKVDGLLYTDDMKVKQIAYLLAFGTFMPASSDSPDLGNPYLLNSLAALTSGGLNKLLAGVLNDKWSIGTDITGFNEVAINVSGSLFDDRLTVNGSVGYHNRTGLMNNFTGDFNMEYKLISSGNLVLKAYNATNNQYYEQAPTTQGVGVVYKRKARTFRNLFDKFKKEK